MERQGLIDGGKAIGLSEDEVHRLLGAERRRLALELLAERGATDLESLAEDIVRREGHDAVSEGAIKRVTIDLYHRHVPLMADLGVIEFDRGSRRVVACRLETGVL